MLSRLPIPQPRVLLARVAAVLAAVLGLTALAGWAFDLPLLRSVVPGAVQMKANTGVALLLAGGALFILADLRSTWQRAAQAAALAVGVLGLATCGEYAFGWQLGIDELLFRDTSNAYNTIRGRMSPVSAGLFAVLGPALAALPLRGVRRPVRVVAVLLMLLSSVSLVAYLWDAAELTTDRWLPPLALHTAIAFLSLGVGMLLCCEPRPGLGRASGEAQTRIEGRILAAFVAALVLLLSAGGYTYRTSDDYADAMESVARSQQTRSALRQLNATLVDSSFAHINYLITGKPSQREKFMRRSADARAQLAAIERATASEDILREHLSDLGGLIARMNEIRQHNIAVYESQGFGPIRERLSSDPMRDTVQAIRAQFDRMDAVEAGRVADLAAYANHLRSSTLLSLLVTLAVATGVFALLFYGVRREIRVRSESERFAETHRQLLSRLAAASGRQQSLEAAVELLAAEHDYVSCAFHTFTGTDGALICEAAYGATLIEDNARAEATHARALPVSFRDERFGVLTIAARHPLNKRERAFLEKMAAQLAVALNNCKQYDDIRVLADQLRLRNAEITGNIIELEQANRMKNEFLSTMSHELRTPLNTIIGFADVLRHGLLGELTEPQRDHAGDILESGQHLLSLINDMLDLSKEAGQTQLESEPLELLPLLQSAIGMVTEKALASRLQLTLDVEDGLPPFSADARKLKQLLYNLLSNAIKFTGEGGAVVLKAERCSMVDGDRLVLSVADTGVGISEADQARLFEPFVQLDSSLARNYGGTGLGLAMVKRLAELHGGEVALASEPGKGSKFTVSLPYVITNPPPKAVHRHSVPDASAARNLASFPERRLTVLVIDDDELAVEIVGTFLEAAGFNVIRTVDPRQALEQAQQRQPDLVILDLVMPKMSGFEVLDALKAEASTREIPIIALTGKKLTVEDGLALDTRISAVLQKDGFERSSFIGAVHRALSGASAGHVPLRTDRVGPHGVVSAEGAQLVVT